MQVLVVEVERFVVVVDLGQVRVGEDVRQHAELAADARADRTVRRAHPAALPLLLVFPFLRVADPGLGLDVVEPGVLHAFAAGPDVLAGDRAGVATNAFVEVQHHADLRTNFHGVSPQMSWGSGCGRASPPGHRVVVAATGAGGLAAGYVHDAFLGVVHHHHAVLDPLADHRAAGRRAVGVEHLDPIVIDDPGLGRVVLAEPDDRTAARQGEHQQVVAVGGVDAPFLVRGDPVQGDLRVAVGLPVQQLLGGPGVDRRPVADEAFAERLHPRVVLVELLATGDGAPRDQLVDVGVAGVVADVLVLEAGPGRAGDDLARLHLDVAEADLLVFLGQRQVGVLAAGDLRQRFPGLDRDLAVGFRSQGEDHLGGVDGAVDARAALADAALDDAMVEVADQLHFLLGVPADALAAVAQLVQQRTERGELAVDVRVVALDQVQRRQVASRHRLALALLPVMAVAAERLRQLGGGVVQQRHRDQVLLHAEVAFGDGGELLGDGLVDLPVALGFPGRIGGRRQRMDEGVHVGGVEVVLLVPRSGRQDDVRVHAGGGHAEVQGGDQVELALGTVVDPVDLGGTRTAGLAEVIVHHPVLRPEQVLEHVLVALAGGAQQVGAPDEHVAREVLRIVRRFAGEAQAAALQFAHHVVGDRQAGGLGLGGDAQRVAVQLRRRRQPAEAFGLDVVVQGVFGEAAGVGQRRQHLVHRQLLVAPLRAVQVEEAGAVHLPRRPAPVQAEGQRRPAGLRAQLLLADIVRPAAAALADAAAHHQHVDDCAVVHVHVVPVVHRRTDDHHRLAAGLVGAVGELAGDLRRARRRNAGDALLPGRGIGRVGVLVGGRHVVAAQAAVDAVVGHLQVVDGGHPQALAVRRDDLAERHPAQQ